MTKQLQTIEKTAGDFLRKFEVTLPTYAVKDYRQDTFVKSAMIAIMGSEDLQECLLSEAGQLSMVNAMRAAAGTGLSLNPLEGKAALIAYNKKINNKWVKTAQYQVMSKGLVDLANDSGKVETITTDTVRENDVFEIMKSQKGDEYRFSPARRDRGQIDGFFASILMKDKTTHIKYMAIEEILEHREKYAKNITDKDGKENANHAWNKSLEGMAIKTVLKRLLRHLHISTDIDQAIGADDQRPEPVDITPRPGKGTSADELTETLKAKRSDANQAEKPETVEAEIVEPGDGEQAEMDMGGKSESVI